MMETVLGISAFVLALVFLFYQLARNEKVYKIRINWINKNDPRYSKYTYEDMFLPSLKNWFGLKFPKESDFMKEKYILVCWPDSQILMEQVWFDECILMNDDNHLKEIGSSAYFVPENRYNELKLK